MGEVSIIWPHLRSPVDYPFLSADKNKELHRRIAVHIVDGCQTLFNDHVAKLKGLLHGRHVYETGDLFSNLKQGIFNYSYIMICCSAEQARDIQWSGQHDSAESPTCH